MLTFDYPPILAEQDMIPEYIRGGSFGRVYQVSQSADLVAKVQFKEHAFSILEKECLIAQRLYEAGISVPEPKGMYTLNWAGRGNKLWARERDSHWCWGQKFVPGFVMKRVRGMRIDDLLNKSKLYVRARELQFRELEKAKESGFIPYVIGDFNAFYLQQEDRVVLFDFETWRME